MTERLKGWARPRPLRVAFLVEIEEPSQFVLDAVFRDCHSRWGGRFSLITPCRNGVVDEAWWPWLEAFDADVVYAYPKLSREQVMEIEERLSPGYCLQHQSPFPPRNDSWDYRPDYRFAPLSSLSTVFRHARHRSGALALQMLHSVYNGRTSRFFNDNFGTFDSGHGGEIIPSDARSILTLRTVDTGRPDAPGAISNETAAFDLFAQSEATSMSIAALLYAPKLAFETRWARSFNLVVGDSVEDRLMFWNARLHLPAWLDTDLHCLRVTQDQLGDETFLMSLRTFLKRRNRVNGGSGGPSQVTLRSTSVSLERLSENAAQLRGQETWNVILTEQIADLSALVPEDHALERSRDGARFGGGFHGLPDWTEFDATQSTFRPPATSPDHLSDAPPRQAFTQGHWAVDLDVEQAGAPVHAGVNRWRLCRRWPLERAFALRYAPVTLNQIPPPPRRARGGLLAAFVTPDTPIDHVGLPDAKTAIRQSLTTRGYGADEPDLGRFVRPERVAWTRPGAQAGYLDGVLGLFGGLDTAAAVLLHPFLTSVFADLGGTTRKSSRATENIATSLLEQARKRAAFDLQDEADRSALADVVIKTAAQLKNSGRYLTHAALKTRWERYRLENWPEDLYAHLTPDEARYIRDDEAASLDRCLIGMRAQRVLHQGHSWTCDACHHRNWMGLSGLAEQSVCEVCRKTSPTPISLDWRFRPNSFLIESLRTHSILSLIWTLRTLADQARTSFLYAGPTELGFERSSESSDAEIDLLVVRDGISMVCEVKSSWTGVTRAERDKLVDAALRLRPDRAVLAVMDHGSKQAKQLAAIEARLAAEGISFALLTLPDQADHDRSLPFA